MRALLPENLLAPCPGRPKPEALEASRLNDGAARGA